MSAKRAQQSVDGARGVGDWLRDWTPKLQSVAGSSAGEALLQKALIPLLDDVLDVAVALLKEGAHAADALRGPVLKRLLEKEGLLGAAPPGSRGDESAAGPPPRPPGMAKPDEATDFMRSRQRRDPTRWTMTIQQWSDTIDHIVALPEYQALKKAKRFVSMYDVNDLFVKPWTRGTGCSVAVLMSKDVEEQAQLMLSHAWGEDVEELQESVMSHVKQEGIPLDATIWFCVFGNYQPGDSFGPSIGEQLEMNPFASVIGSDALKTGSKGQGMVAVHTTKADLYSRLWCVHEVERASVQKDVRVAAAMSEDYIKGMVSRVQMLKLNGGQAGECLEAADVFVSTIKAKCGNPADEPMLIKLVQESGGFKKLDQIISDFRKAMLPEAVLTELVSECGLTLENAGSTAQVNLTACRFAVCSDVTQFGVVHHSLRDKACLAWARPLFRLITKEDAKATIAVLQSLDEEDKRLGKEEKAKALKPMIPMLVRLLEHEDCWRRVDAMKMLSCARVSVKVAELVAERLWDSDIDIRTAARECLTQLAKGENLEVSAIAKHHLDEEAYDQSHGEEDVKELANKSVEEIMKDIGDDDADVVNVVCLALGKKRAETAVPKLIELLEHNEWLIRQGAARALARMGEAAAPALMALTGLLEEDTDRDVQVAAAAALGSIRAEASVEVLARVVLDSDRTENVQLAALQSLGRLGSVAAAASPDLAELLLKMEDVEDSSFGLELIKVLTAFADLEPGVAVPALLPKLVACNHPSCPWHEGVAEALSRLGAAAAPVASELAKGLEKSKDSKSRQLAAKALGAMGEHAEVAAPVLAKRLADKVSDVREAACVALVKIGAKGAAAAQEVVKHCEGDRSGPAIQCLGAMGVAVKDVATPVLLKHVADPDSDTFVEATIALCKVGSAEVVLPLLRSALEKDHIHALQALAGFGRAARPLVPMLVERVPRRNDWRLEKRCVEALGAIARDGAAADIAGEVMPVILKVAEDEKADIDLRQACLCALLIGFSDLPSAS